MSKCTQDHSTNCKKCKLWPSLPETITASEGSTVTIIAIEGIWPVPYVQWQVSTNQGCTWRNISGENDPCLILLASENLDGNCYRAFIQRSCQCYITNETCLHVNVPPPPPPPPPARPTDYNVIGTQSALGGTLQPRTRLVQTDEPLQPSKQRIESGYTLFNDSDSALDVLVRWYPGDASGPILPSRSMPDDPATPGGAQFVGGVTTIPANGSAYFLFQTVFDMVKLPNPDPMLQHPRARIRFTIVSGQAGSLKIFPTDSNGEVVVDPINPLLLPQLNLVTQIVYEEPATITPNQITPGVVVYGATVDIPIPPPPAPPTQVSGALVDTEVAIADIADAATATGSLRFLDGNGADVPINTGGDDLILPGGTIFQDGTFEVKPKGTLSFRVSELFRDPPLNGLNILTLITRFNQPGILRMGAWSLPRVPQPQGDALAPLQYPASTNLPTYNSSRP